jgi:hypothetical protein
MVIAIPVRKYLCKELLNFLLRTTFAKKCQQRVMTITLWRAETAGAGNAVCEVHRRIETRVERRDVATCERISDKP